MQDRIRTSSGIEHSDVAGRHALASSAYLQAAAQPELKAGAVRPGMAAAYDALGRER